MKFREKKKVRFRDIISGERDTGGEFTVNLRKPYKVISYVRRESFATYLRNLIKIKISEKRSFFNFKTYSYHLSLSTFLSPLPKRNLSIFFVFQILTLFLRFQTCAYGAKLQCKMIQIERGPKKEKVAKKWNTG